MRDNTEQVARFAPNQTLPPGYRVVSHVGSEHWCWDLSNGTYGDMHWDRYRARRDAWAHWHNSTKQ